MKIVALSDMHGHLPSPKIFPECDVVCVCGDIVPLEYQTDTVKSATWFVLEFNDWANKLHCKKVIFIAGNHDFFLERISDKGLATPKEVMKTLFPGNSYSKTKLIYLCDNSVTIDGVKFYGTPWIANLPRWAFFKNDEDLADVYDRIPHKVDVLLTHMPSFLGDTGLVMQHGYSMFRQFGNAYLAKVILERDIKYALCGHVHSGSHVPYETKEGGCKVVNVSLKDEDYRVNYNVFEFEL